MSVETTKKKMTTNIDSELAKKFKVRCIESGKTMTDVLEEFMKTYIKQTETNLYDTKKN